MNTGMNIGTVVDKDSLGALTDSLLAIMAANADQETKRHAMDALARMARVEGVTIQHCVVNGDRSVKVHVDAATAEVTHGPDEEQDASQAGIRVSN